jgi:hypothetical protein
VNPWIVAAIAAAALWLLFGRGQARAADELGDGSRPAGTADTSGGDVSAVALPPGSQVGGSSVGPSVVPTDHAIVSTYSAEPVGSSSMGVDTSAGQAAIAYQASESAISQLVNQVQAGQVPASALASIPTNTQAGAFAASVTAQQAAIAAQPGQWTPGLARHTAS